MREYIVEYKTVQIENNTFFYGGKIKRNLIRCQDCKWFRKEAHGEMWCGHLDGIAIDENAFCSDAERKKK